jgi:thioredoxin reductase (NADPH)
MIPSNIDPSLVLTSDDIFSLKSAPGKTLVVGASYVALECAGFLKGCGYDTTVMVRSVLLRGFDQQMANLVGKYMKEQSHINFINGATVHTILPTQSGKKLVTYNYSNGSTESQEYDTIFYATGREIDTNNLIDESLNIKINPKNKKIITNDKE